MTRASDDTRRKELDAAADPVRQTVTWSLLQLQKRKGFLSKSDLVELSETLGCPLYQLEEVVSFFPHFRREPPPRCEVHVCRDLVCHQRGSPQLVDQLRQSFAGQTGVRIRPVSCLGRCDRAPAVVLEAADSHGEEGEFPPACLGRNTQDVVAAVTHMLAGSECPSDRDIDAPPPAIHSWRIDPYPHEESRYGAIRQLKELFYRRRGDMDRAIADLNVLGKLRFANLRGMGGAGEPAASKWSTVADQTVTPKFIVCNADESEPLTFKDREILLHKPHLVIEGMVLAGLICGADRGYIYLRHEYPEQAAMLRAAIAEAERLQVCGADIVGGISFHLSVYISPGGYICGEQSALIEAMEGHRAQPRNRPPDLKSNGLFDKPTLVSNVETFAWVPGIAIDTTADPAENSGEEPVSVVVRGAAAAKSNWYAELGYHFPKLGYRGARLFSVCGDVVRPGVYEIPIGAPLRDLLAAAGGVIGGEKELRAIATSGPSGGFLPPQIRDARMVEKLIKKLQTDRDRAAGSETGFIDKLEQIRADLRSRPNSVRSLRELEDVQLQLHDAPFRALRIEAWLRTLQPDAQQMPGEIDVLATPLDIDMFRSLSVLRTDIMLGAGLAVFAGSKVDLLSLAVNATEFFSHESCGKCVPCRVGSGRLVEFGQGLVNGAISGDAIPETLEVIQQLDAVMKATSICGLGWVAPSPLVSLVTHFPEVITSRKAVGRS